jgi:hypothetical protein
MGSGKFMAKIVVSSLKACGLLCLQRVVGRSVSNTEYVINLAFPRQQWFRKSFSMLRYTYIVCLSFSHLFPD